MPWLRWTCLLLGGCAAVPVPAESPLVGDPAAAPATTVVPPTMPNARKRAHELGIVVGNLPAGPRNAITDVAGVRVGHHSLHDGDRVHTGVTVVLPPGDNPFTNKVPAALVVQNGFGKAVGGTQVQELGELESPVALCGTLNVHRVADGLLDWLLGLPGNENVRSANVVVGETNDGRLSDIRSRPLGSEHVRAAIAAAGEDVQVGAVGAGAGTVCFGWKGGIGTASRRVGRYTVGVLVQTNFGGALVVDGVPVHNRLRPEDHGAADRDGSCWIVLATDAPVDAAALRRIAARTFAGMARTGASFSHGSGDYALAFATAGDRDGERVVGDALSPLFVAAADATEQAILDSLCAALTTTGMGRTVPAIPLDWLQAILAEGR